MRKGKRSLLAYLCGAQLMGDTGLLAVSRAEKSKAGNAYFLKLFWPSQKPSLKKKNCEKLWMHLNTSEYIWVHLNGAEYFCILLNTFRYFSVSGSFEYIRTYLDTSGYLWVHLDTFQYIGIYFKKTNYGQKMIHCWVFFLLWYKSTCGIHQLDLAFDASIAQLRGRHHHR